MRYFLLGLSLSLACVPPLLGQTSSPKLLLAFASVRGRHAPPYPKIHFYEHDGVATGKIIGSIDSVDGGVNKTRADMHPSLSRDGRYCAVSAQFGITDGARIEIWDRETKKFLPLPDLHGRPKVHEMSPSFSGDGKSLAFSAWAWPGASSRWGVFLYDVPAGKVVVPPKLNHDAADQRLPAISGDGRILAFASNLRGNTGRTDIVLYDLASATIMPIPHMNSPSTEMQPALDGEGRLIAFASDRPGGSGGRDIYLYDRTDKRFVPLPGLNSPSHEQSPCLSADGRFLAFVSERLDGAGERDVYLYDRKTARLLPTPDLNSKDDDFDPCVIVLGNTNDVKAPRGIALPPIETVDFDHRIGFRVNGRPFFPILLYDAPTDERTLEELRAFGFNTLSCAPGIEDSFPARGFYGAVHHGKKDVNPAAVLLALGMDSPALHFKKDLLAQVAGSNAKTRAAIPGRPVMNAIGYWEDEPEGVYTGKIPSRQKYEDLVAAIDVSAPYLYPVPYQPVASVGEAVARARTATGGTKPLLPILQLFAWKNADRYPTSAELRAMAFLALVEGAHGIGYYSFGSVTGRPKTTLAVAQPELWSSVRTLNREIAAIGPRLIAGERTDLVAVEKAAQLRFKAVRDDQGVLAVLVNPGDAKNSVKLTFREVHDSPTLSDGRKLVLQRNEAVVSIGPFGVETIRLNERR